MNELIQYKTENGDTVYVEIEKPKDFYGGRTNISTTQEKKITESQSLLEKSFKTIKHVAEGAIASINDLVEKPDELEVKIGLKLTGEANAVIAKSSLEGNIEVTIKWTKNSTTKNNLT